MIPAKVGVLQRPVQRIARPFFRRLWPTVVEGLENIPSGRGAILCPNHLSVFDSFLLPSVLPRPLIFVGKAEYLDDWKTRRLFPALGMIPIERGGGSRVNPALDAAQGVIDAGGLFGIYPEGTRSRSTHLHKGHTGAARLAIDTGAPIIPVGIVGTLEIQPPGQVLAVDRRGHVRDRRTDRTDLRRPIRLGEGPTRSRAIGRPGGHVVARRVNGSGLASRNSTLDPRFEP